MIRSTASKVMWVGRATVFLVGLSVILALVLGVATTAMGANGQNFILGKAKNAATKVTGLVGNVDGGAALRVTNPNAGTNDTALDLRVQAGEAPMKVSGRAAKVANLDADKLDGKNFSAFMSSQTYLVEEIWGIAASGVRSGDVLCDDGDQAISGGLSKSFSDTIVFASLRSDSSERAWRFTVARPSGSTSGDQLTVQAVCADLPPLRP